MQISCVMPTTARRTWCIPWAVEYFLAQNFKSAELLVVSDGSTDDEEIIRAILPDHPRVRHVHLPSSERIPLGHKYNRGVELARHDLVALWADDDWHAPWRLQLEVAALARRGAEIVGLRRMLFHRMGTRRTFVYETPKLASEPYFLGGSVLFRKSYWLRHRFDDEARRRADASFTNDIDPEEYARVAHPIGGYGWYLATIHDDNTGRRNEDPSGPGWSRWDGRLEELMRPSTAARYVEP